MPSAAFTEFWKPYDRVKSFLGKMSNLELKKSIFHPKRETQESGKIQNLDLRFVKRCLWKIVFSKFSAGVTTHDAGRSGIIETLLSKRTIDQSLWSAISRRDHSKFVEEFFFVSHLLVASFFILDVVDSGKLHCSPSLPICSVSFSVSIFHVAQRK